MTWEYLPITENISAREVEANMMPEDGAEYQVKLVEANGVQYQWNSMSGVS